MKLVLALLAALAAASPAHAELPRTVPIDNTLTRESVLIAERFLGAAVPCGQVRFYLAELGTEPGLTPYARADAATCTIWLDPLATMVARYTRCTIIIHEIGHLHGRPESPRGASVMFREINRPVRSCVRRFAPQLRIRRFAVR